MTLTREKIDEIREELRADYDGLPESDIDALCAMASAVALAIEALERIASFKRAEKTTNGYGLFTEPASARIAREALAKVRAEL